MDGVTPFGLILFLIATFAAALVAGVAGFAFGVVAAAIWLHILTPLETATLIVVFGLIVQGYAVWQLRHALNGRRLWPFLIGGALGVPLGVEALRWADPGALRQATGIILVLFSAWSLARPKLRPVTGGGAAADGGIGFLSGVLGGTTGLGGILPTLWCNLRGWPKDEQRAVFQPAAVAIFVMTALWLGASGSLAARTAFLIVLGLPALLLGTWLGLRLYRRLDERGFRVVVLTLLLVSGLTLLAR